MYFTGWIIRHCPKSVFSTRGLSPSDKSHVSKSMYLVHFRPITSHLPFSPKSRPAFASSMASHRLEENFDIHGMF